MESSAPGLLATDVPGGLARVAALISREALLVVSFAAFVGALVWRLPGQVNQDAWLALVSGREIVHHFLPARETLTMWPAGAQWIDQQWLAQLALYAVYLAGGLALLAAVHAVLTAGAYATAIVAARRLGGSPRSVLFVLPACFWLLIGSTWQVRTQTLAYLPFAVLIWLLAADARKPSGRVFLALPLLALWANLHGSVVLAAGLVGLRGLSCLRARETRLRGAALAALAPLSLLASPYGVHVVGYYASTLFNPAFGAMLNEWQPTTLGLMTAPFFALLLATVLLVGRARASVPLFDQLALLATATSGLLAQRNLGWFALTAIVVVPRLVDEVLPTRALKPPRANLALAAIGTIVLVALLAGTLRRPDGYFRAGYPDEASTVVAQSAARLRTPVFADVKYGDWLLWREPQLRGRVAYDARFELLPVSRIAQIYDFNTPYGRSWSAAARGYRLLVLDSSVSHGPIRDILRERGARLLYARHGVTILLRAS